MSNKKNNIKLDIKQWESLLISLFLRANKTNSPMQHVEDIAIENKKKFPNFFSWSKYKEHIDLRQVMRTMDKLKDDGFVNGSNTKMWTLSKKGFDYAEKISEYNLSSESKKIRSNSDYYSHEMIRILKSPCFVKFKKHTTDEIENSEVKYLFRIDSYNSSVEAIKRNRERLYIASKESIELTQFLEAMWKLLIERKIINKEEF
jgi:hypothetical protein